MGTTLGGESMRGSARSTRKSRNQRACARKALIVAGSIPIKETNQSHPHDFIQHSAGGPSARGFQRGSSALHRIHSGLGAVFGAYLFMTSVGLRFRQQ